MIAHLFSLFRKDLALEISTKETISFSFFIVIALSVIIALGISSSFIKQQEIASLFPALYWIVVVFLSVLTCGRSFEVEAKNSSIEALFLSGTSPALIFISKTVSGFIILTMSLFFGLLALATLLDVSFMTFATDLVVIIIMSAFALCSLSALIAPVASSSRLKNVLFVMISLPLIFPIYLCGLELTFQAFTNTNGYQLTSFWFMLLAILDIVYFLIGLNLYSYVIGE